MTEKKMNNKRKSTSNKNNKSTKKTGKNQEQARRIQPRVVEEIWGFVLVALGIFIFAAVQFNAAGEFGSILGRILRGAFGWLGLVLPWYMIIFGILLFVGKTTGSNWRNFLYNIIIFLMLGLANSGHFIDEESLVYSLKTFYTDGIILESGGVIPMALGTLIVQLVGKVGLYVTSAIGIFVPSLLVINTPISRGIGKMKQAREEKALQKEAKREERNEKNFKEEVAYPPIEEEYSKSDKSYPTIMDMDGVDELNSQAKYHGFDLDPYTSDKNSGGSYSGLYLEPSLSNENEAEKVDFGDSKASNKPVEITNREAKEAILSENDINKTTIHGRYKKPGMDLLMSPEPHKNKIDGRKLAVMAETLEKTLASFNVDAKVINVTQGPTITRYEIQPNVGVKVNSIVRLADDIALNLRAKSIRIEAPIPGKAAVGIEVENDSISMVRVSEILGSKEFKSAKSKITFGVGMDISGKPIVADLKTMPHLLIAGSTGSGKSVCINSLIASILYKSTPEEVKLVLIDPKVVELGNYNGIPHLLIPVVTEPAKAAAALNWAVAEMNDRYNKFAEAGVRGLHSYNDEMKQKREKEKILPEIVIIIDELADLMMAAPSQVEESICRLAQKARAAGMHMVVATQRPSVDVITGLIKANIPSRIAFAVSSQFDSRTILDMAGAEKLVGKGDMLFNPLGMGKPVRVQGAFISDDEVHKIIEFVKSQVEEVEYSKDVIKTIESGNINEDAKSDEDELMDEAIECVIGAGQASVSMLQRRFRVGYNRAARIIEAMEARGIVTPQDGSKPRQVLISEDEFNQMKLGSEE